MYNRKNKGKERGEIFRKLRFFNKWTSCQASFNRYEMGMITYIFVVLFYFAIY